MRNNKVLPGFEKKEYENFYNWLLDRDDVEIVSEIDMSRVVNCQDPRNYYTKEIKAFFETKAMKRLEKIGQLGNVIMNDPSSVHNRLEHCKGAYQRMLFFYMKQFQNLNWRKNNSSKIDRENILADIMDMASHDIGHNVLSHALEKLISDEKGAHEVIGKRILREDEEVCESLKKINPNIFEALDRVQKNEYGLKTLKEGNIDFDRGDFLVRDSIYLGRENGFELSEVNDKSIMETLDETLNQCEIKELKVNGVKGKYPVFKYSVVPDIERFLSIREENYRKIYVSPVNKPFDIYFENFCNVILQNKEDICLEFKDFLNHLIKHNENEISIQRYLEWNDIKFYNQLFDVVRHSKDENFINYAVGCMPNNEGFLNILYSRIMPQLDNKINRSHGDDIGSLIENEDDKKFYYNVRELCKDESSQMAKRILTHDRKSNYVSFEFEKESQRIAFMNKIKKGFDVYKDGKKKGYLKLDDEVIEYFKDWNSFVKIYNPKEPILIEAEDGNIVPFNRYEKTMIDFTPKEYCGKVVFLDEMRMAGCSETQVEQVKLIKEFAERGLFGEEFKSTYVPDKVLGLYSDIEDLSYKLKKGFDVRKKDCREVTL